MNYLIIILCGFVIGLSNIIPGVSGGTIAVSLNIFDRIISSISNFRKDIKGNVKFLSAILIGAAVAIILFSKAINMLLGNYYMATNFFFIGVILGSIPLVFDKATHDKFKISHLIPCLITLGIMLVMAFFVPSAPQEIITTLTLFTFIKLFLLTIVSAMAMIIPGISGSFVMLLFGVYTTVTTAIDTFDILILIPIGLGAIVGIAIGSKTIDKLLKKFPQATYFAILGFMIGSVVVIFQKIAQNNAYNLTGEFGVGILVFVVGLAMSYLFTNEKFKAKISRGKSTKK